MRRPPNDDGYKNRILDPALATNGYTLTIAEPPRLQSAGDNYHNLFFFTCKAALLYNLHAPTLPSPSNFQGHSTQCAFCSHNDRRKLNARFSRSPIVYHFLSAPATQQPFSTTTSPGQPYVFVAHLFADSSGWSETTTTSGLPLFLLQDAQ